MSRMFDALRRAEEERRKRAGQNEELSGREGRPEPRKFQPGWGELPDSLFRELGILRNSLDSSLKEKEKRAILFTCSTPGEGTTTICSSLARLLALEGREKVLLCEMNARNPSLKSLFSLNGDNGVTDFFSGNKNLASIVQNPGGFSLDIAPIGRADPAMVQLHIPQLFPKLVEAALSVYTTVLFDAPPVAKSPETPPMSSFVDGVVMVVQAGKTKREVVQRSLGAISQFDGRILGIILNRKKYYIPEFLYKRI